MWHVCERAGFMLSFIIAISEFADERIYLNVSETEMEKERGRESANAFHINGANTTAQEL